jgi:hypothetical protein
MVMTSPEAEELRNISAVADIPDGISNFNGGDIFNGFSSPKKFLICS